jgi:hypothetical protein
MIYYGYKILKTASGVLPIAAMSPLTTIGRSRIEGWASIASINCLSLLLKSTPSSCASFRRKMSSGRIPILTKISVNT